MNINYDFKIDGHPTLNIYYTSQDFSKRIQFKVPHDFFISTDSIVAIALACRPKFIDSISFSFPISNLASSVITSDYNISITDTKISNCSFVGFENPRKHKKRKIRILNFSGGVDSLGANYLCSGDVDLMSLDFGKRFSRERSFFQEWDTKIIETDLRDKPLNENLDWRFMASGGLLMSDYLGIETIFFGTILEASPWWFKFQDRSSFEDSVDYQVFRLSKVRIALPTVCLSEYGTTLLASKYGNEVLEKSINSAADFGTSKYFRKILLKKIVLNEEITQEWANINKPHDLKPCGSSFSEDILAMYFAQKLGFEFVDKYILKTSDDFKKAKSEIDMGFFEKCNQKNMQNIPFDIKEKIRSRVAEAGIKDYNETDAENITKLRSYLSNIYKFKN